MLEKKSYQGELKEYYRAIIEPFFNKTKLREKFFFNISVGLLLALSIFTFFRTHESLLVTAAKFLLGFAVWSFCFMCIHVNFHVNMLKYNHTLKQRIFPFYHHYVDVFLYQKHKENYNGAHLDAMAFFIIPVMMIDNMVGAAMFLAALVDLYTHRWYHTRTEYRKKDFNPAVFKMLTFLESTNIINTREHIRVHHSHDVNHLQDVKGWLDVFWPIIGKKFDRLGDKLYDIFKHIPHLDFLIWGIVYSFFAILWFLLGKHALHSSNLEVIIVELFVLSFLCISSLHNKKILPLLKQRQDSSLFNNSNYVHRHHQDADILK